MKTRSIKRIVKLTGISLVVLLMTTVSLLGEDIPPEPNELGPEKVALTPVQKQMLQRVSIDFRQTAIEDVLRSMAQQADIDIIKSPKVVGEVTATLTDVPLGEALTNILLAHGYAYISSENMIRIVPVSEIAKEQKKLINRVYQITYADVEDVYNALRKFISDEGNIAYNKGTSHLIITDVESKMNAIETFITEVDQITTQIMVEARIYDVTATDRLDLGIEWTAGKNTTYSGTDGIETLGGVGGLATNPFVTALFDGTTNKATDTDGLIRFGILNDSLNIDAILRAEDEDIWVKLLANPRVMVINNEEALIKIVEEIPFQELTQTSAGGDIGTTEFREVGVELTVTPHVTRDDLIRLKLHSKFSVNTGDVVLPGINNASPQPIIATRETITTALVRDGQTVVIGGLRKQDVVEQINKVPFLGDIPLIGNLFKFTGKKNVVNELVVFITPHIIKIPTLTPLEMKQLEATKVPTPLSLDEKEAMKEMMKEIDKKEVNKTD